MPINKKEITKEMLEKAMQCKTADELMAVASQKALNLPKSKQKHIWRS